MVTGAGSGLRIALFIDSSPAAQNDKCASRVLSKTSPFGQYADLMAVRAGRTQLSPDKRWRRNHKRGRCRLPKGQPRSSSSPGSCPGALRRCNRPGRRSAGRSRNPNRGSSPDPRQRSTDRWRHRYRRRSREAGRCTENRSESRNHRQVGSEGRIEAAELHHLHRRLARKKQRALALRQRAAGRGRLLFHAGPPLQAKLQPEARYKRSRERLCLSISEISFPGYDDALPGSKRYKTENAAAAELLHT
jgi:hypothetical protein